MSNTSDKLKNFGSDQLDELKSFDWGDLQDLDTIGIWPAIVKFLICMIIFIAVIFGGYWFHIKNLQVELDAVAADESSLRSDLESKAVLAANLEAYRQQLQDMEDIFGTLLRQLPGETEVPGLLDDITFTGIGSGLEFSNIQLMDEQAEEFYVELPINISVKGGYHDFGSFVSGVASLPRIVTLHDFRISTGENRSELNMDITARTYRYNADDE